MKKIKAILTTIGVLSFALLPTVGFAQLAFAQDPTTPLECGTRNGTWDGANNICTGADTAITTTANDVVKKVINILSWVVGVISVIMIIIAGFRYVTSGGQEKSVTGAKNTIMYAIIGLVVVALAQVIVRFIVSNVSET
jgi:hypothetical protein